MPSTFAQNATTPSAPGLTFLYSLNCTLGTTIDIGYGPKGHRVAIPITGGYFNGPRMSGNISDLGADWGTTDNKTGVFSADTRYNLVTNDGANIYVQTSGPQQPDGHLHLRQIFETGHPDYYWLNNIVSVGILTARDGWVSIDGWQLESPIA
ncbi:hypothetical protein M406DRAFT_264650 [Cryphonectria parasitica EP155]|uniref:Uncharacterized protein n=1 Tax=Cryphonectria parasitica (strain ATCC 38755 / EP155) TaxID=660469 RepID=A0A9P4XWE6_CRYP1|nr:uncharacterized protein M406DRAFT_264650 [Cryphonectria parasitica EP155]KAF3762238.1 hypothetical protein M406DRAFT_264650 [Cryphonectria parasitica EP155]